MTSINSRASGDKRRVEGALHTMQAEIDDPLHQAKRAMETQLGELENRLADANESAMRGGKSAMAKLETKIKELQFQNDEDHKNQDRMSELASKLQGKIKTYKKQ